MTWELNIRRVQNGFVLKYTPDEGEEGCEKSEFVINFDEDADDEKQAELKAMEKLLWQVKEYFGVYWSKHNKRNLNIEIVKRKEDE